MRSAPCCEIPPRNGGTGAIYVMRTPSGQLGGPSALLELADEERPSNRRSARAERRDHRLSPLADRRWEDGRSDRVEQPALSSAGRRDLHCHHVATGLALAD